MSDMIYTTFNRNKGSNMYIHKVGEFEVIFDSEEQYDLVTCHGGKRRSIWIDKSIKNKPYARMSYTSINVRVHHIIIGHPLNKLMVDHFNGNSLDNRMENLRVVTRAENAYNSPSQNDHRWITRQKSGRFTATARYGLGTYDTEAEAREAVRQFLKTRKVEIYGDFYERNSSKK